MTPFYWFWAGGSAGAWSVLRLLFGINDPLLVFGGWRRWREFFSESTAFSWSSAGGGAGAWNVLRILLGIDDHLVVFGGCWRWSVERPESSVRNRRPSRGFRRVAALARGASSVAIGDPLAVFGGWRRYSSEFCSQRFSVGGGAGAWSMLKILFVIGDTRGFWRVAALARGASSDFCWQLATLSSFWAGGGAVTCSVLRSLDPLQWLAWLGAWGDHSG